MIIPIRGLHTIYNDDTEDFYYVNRKMLNSGVFFKTITLENPEIELGTYGCIETMIQVSITSKDGEFAGSYIMHWGPLLSPIQIYGIIKDLYFFYMDMENYIDGFVEFLEDSSTSYSDSTMNRGNNHESLPKEIDEELKILSELLKDIETSNF